MVEDGCKLDKSHNAPIYSQIIQCIHRLLTLLCKKAVMVTPLCDVDEHMLLSWSDGSVISQCHSGQHIMRYQDYCSSRIIRKLQHLQKFIHYYICQWVIIRYILMKQQKTKISAGQGQTLKIAGDLLQVDQTNKKINNLNTNKMQEISAAARNRIQKKQVLSDVTSQVHKIQKIQSLTFDEQLNLDMLIQRVLKVLVSTKVQVLGLDDISTAKQDAKYKSFFQYFDEQLKKYNKTIMLRQSQLGSLVYVIDHRKQVNFEKNYLQVYGELDKFIISPQQAKKPINTFILQQAFQKQIEYLQQYTEAVIVLKNNFTQNKHKNDIETIYKNANKLKIINSKIATIAEIFPYACVLDKNDLFSFHRNSQRWKKLTDKCIRYKIYGDKESIKKSFLLLKNGLNFVNASMSIMHKTRGNWVGTAQDFGKDLSSLAQSTSKIFKFLIFKEDATHQAEVLISDPDGRLAKQIWNLPQQKMLRNLISLTLPSITYSKQFWIPRKYTQYLISEGKSEMPSTFISNMSTYIKHLYQPKQHKQRLQMRVNCPFNLTHRYEKLENDNPVKNFFDNIFTKNKQQSQLYPTQLIYHIHGGGFISMSSFVHQAYTRIWANNLRVPIISVDYGKAPQYPFPNGLYDCFQGYMWVLEYYKQVFSAEPKKIILVGDSAGGNLVAALTSMLIMKKLRVPDGVVLVYPALNLNYHNYTPSLLTSLNDMILPHTFLKICLKSYLRDQYDVMHPYISPIQSPDEVLKQYPPTRIFVGSSDPFHDDCCRLTEKLNNLQPNKAKLMIFDEFPHGFLQFDMKTQPHQSCRKATKEVQEALGQLLKI